MELDLSIVPRENDFQCYNIIDGDIEDELQHLPKKANLLPATGINTEQLLSEPPETVTKSKRLPYAKETEK